MILTVDFTTKEHFKQIFPTYFRIKITCLGANVGSAVVRNKAKAHILPEETPSLQ